MSELLDQIARLNDRQAIQAAAWSAESLWQELQKIKPDLPTVLKGNQLTDDQAIHHLSASYPDVAGSLPRTSAGASEEERAQLSRVFLIVAADEGHGNTVSSAVEQAQFVFPPVLVGMAAAAGIVFLLSIEFKVKYEDGHLSWEIGRDATTPEIVKKILDPLPDVLESLRPPDRED